MVVITKITFADLIFFVNVFRNSLLSCFSALALELQMVGEILGEFEILAPKAKLSSQI